MKKIEEYQIVREFNKKPYYERLFDAYLRAVDENAKATEKAERTRNTLFLEAIKNYNRSSKINTNKVYGYIDITPKSMLGRLAIIRALAAAKSPLREGEIKGLIGSKRDEEGFDMQRTTTERKTSGEEITKYADVCLVGKSIYDECMNDLLRSGMVLRNGNKNNSTYKLSNEIFEGIPAAHVYPFLNFIDHAMPFTGIIHSLFSCYSAAPAHFEVEDENRVRIKDRKKELYRISTIEQVSLNFIMIEYVFWSMLSAYSEQKAILVNYHTLKENKKYKAIRKDEFKLLKLIPYRMVYDNLNSRLHLIAYNMDSEAMEMFDSACLFPVEEESYIDASSVLASDSYKEAVKETEEKLSSAWGANLEGELTEIKLWFKDTPRVRNRLFNERRDGEIFEEAGRLRFEIKLLNNSEIMPWIRSYGADVVDAFPESFKHELCAENEKINAFYAEALL